MITPDVALTGQESALFPAEDCPAKEEPDIEAIFDACFVALIASIVTYGICEAIARWRWWAVAVWVAASLSIPVAIVAGQWATEVVRGQK